MNKSEGLEFLQQESINVWKQSWKLYGISLHVISIIGSNWNLEVHQVIFSVGEMYGTRLW